MVIGENDARKMGIYLSLGDNKDVSGSGYSEDDLGSQLETGTDSWIWRPSSIRFLSVVIGTSAKASSLWALASASAAAWTPGWTLAAAPQTIIGWRS
ncbi:hypothetical protein TIFTF001_036968 [Ficus carica]|uniref:Uncharacterized protein n=1 Tax=Ficus carica TaxID=3494 RepID=A0AA88E4E3_FICCA|nr:hypothetical protein TIFTF001_036952 [Ficus carica]GMN67902.1 hypothetical protein TIFTF001_036968 [Ficus carica]